MTHDSAFAEYCARRKAKRSRHTNRVKAALDTSVDQYDLAVVKAQQTDTAYYSLNTPSSAGSPDLEPGWLRREYSVNRPIR